jgi:hypothetical protein
MNLKILIAMNFLINGNNQRRPNFTYVYAETDGKKASGVGEKQAKSKPHTVKYTQIYT